MANYYVHGDIGSNGGAGTIGDPFLTIGYAISQMSAGDTLYIKGGITYSESGGNSLSMTGNWTFQPYTTDGEKPVIECSGTYMFRLSGGSASAYTLSIKNIIFVMSADGAYAIDMAPTADGPSLLVANCDFIGTFDPYDSTSFGGYGIYRADNGGGAGSGANAQVIVDNCVFHNMEAGVYVHGQTKSSNMVRNSIFTNCGDQDGQLGAITAYRNTGVSSSVLIMDVWNCHFFGCSMDIYSIGITNPTVYVGSLVDTPPWQGNHIEAETGQVLDPLYTDPASYNFKLQTGSPCIDAGRSAVSDANVPPGLGGSDSDIGSWGGPYNLDLSNAMTLTVDGVEQTVYPYDYVSVTGSDVFVRWEGDHSLLSNRYSKTTNLSVGAGGSDITVWSLTGKRIKMTAGRLDMIIEQGSNFKRTITWKDNNGDAVDLTGYSAAMKIKDRIGGNTIDSLVSGGEITLGGAAGTIDINVAASDTASYSFDYGVYDLELTDGSGNVTKLLRGKVRLVKEVTV